jgi:hypothetical protein
VCLRNTGQFFQTISLTCFSASRAQFPDFSACSNVFSSRTLSNLSGINMIASGLKTERTLRCPESRRRKDVIGAPKVSADRTLHTRPTSATHWSLRRFARELGVSSRTLGRVWQEHGTTTLFAALNVADGTVTAQCQGRLPDSIPCGPTGCVRQVCGDSRPVIPPIPAKFFARETATSAASSRVVRRGGSARSRPSCHLPLL